MRPCLKEELQDSVMQFYLFKIIDTDNDSWQFLLWEGKQRVAS